MKSRVFLKTKAKCVIQEKKPDLFFLLEAKKTSTLRTYQACTVGDRFEKARVIWLS